MTGFQKTQIKKYKEAKAISSQYYRYHAGSVQGYMESEMYIKISEEAKVLKNMNKV